MYRVTGGGVTILALTLLAILVVSLVLDFRHTLRTLRIFFDVRLMRSFFRQRDRAVFWSLVTVGLAWIAWVLFAMPGDSFPLFFTVAILVITPALAVLVTIITDLWEVIQNKRHSRRQDRSEPDL